MHGLATGLNIYATRCFQFCDFVMQLNIIVDALRPKAHHTVWKTLYFGKWKACQANPCMGEKGQLTSRRSHKNGGLFQSLIRMSSSLVCFYCTKSTLSAIAARRNKLSFSWSVSLSSYQIPFHLSRSSKIKLSAFELTWHKYLIECHTRNGKHCMACQCSTPAVKPITGCHNQGLQTLCVSYLR